TTGKYLLRRTSQLGTDPMVTMDFRDIQEVSWCIDKATGETCPNVPKPTGNSDKRVIVEMAYLSNLRTQDESTAVRKIAFIVDAENLAHAGNEKEFLIIKEK